MSDLGECGGTRRGQEIKSNRIQVSSIGTAVQAPGLRAGSIVVNGSGPDVTFRSEGLAFVDEQDLHAFRA